MDKASRIRANVLTVLFCAVFFALLARLYHVQVSGHENQLKRAEAQRKGHITVTQPPGTIYDRRNETLAVSIPVDSLWADPSAIEDRELAAGILSSRFGVAPALVRRRLSDPEREFVWIKRQLSEAEAAAVEELKGRPPFKPGRKTRSRARLGTRTEFARRYPLERLAAHVLGFRSRDPKSHEGIERLLSELLTVPDLRVSVLLDGRRRVLGGRDVDLSSVEVVLTLDHLLQGVLEEELDAVCAEWKPKSAVAVVMDPRNGAILAMASRPGFDPNAPGDASASARRNRVLTDPYEPGSTFKPFHIAYALDKGRVGVETSIDCENGLWKYGPRRLHDHHPYGLLTVSAVVEKSSNIGAAKIGVRMGKELLSESLWAFGFGVPTGVDLPAEAGGRVVPLEKWTPYYTASSVTMGHEVAVTPLQLVAAMSAIANGGTLYRPFVVKRVRTSAGVLLAETEPHAVRRVIRPGTARLMTEILGRVVEQGTGKKAQVEGVAVAGKTGTTQKIDPATGQYSHEKFIGSFVGYAPMDAPRMCVAVVLDEPQGKYYGGTVAAPAVGKIIRRGLVYVD